MIVESAVLPIRIGHEAQFEAALREALPLIQASKGFQKIEVRRCVEDKSRYLLLVWWDSVEDHTIGFRQSDRYPKWRALLHHFYDGPLTVLHYEEPVA
jgi:heme-degrading monooxygenase HmoA